MELDLEENRKTDVAQVCLGLFESVQGDQTLGKSLSPILLLWFTQPSTSARFQQEFAHGTNYVV